MTGDRVLLDTGPLVAFLHRDDSHHEECTRFLETFQGVLLSTEAVLTEAMHLLGRVRGGQQTCLEFFIRGGTVLVPATRGSLARCRALMNQYADVPMDYADATLVALAEEAGTHDIFTLDRRGFGAYRPGERSHFRLWPG